MPSPLRITLRNMQFHVRVGVLPHEAELAQPLAIDLVVWTHPPRRGEVSVDYRSLHGFVGDAVRDQPLRYLETIAQDIVARCMAHELVTGARASVRKPHVSLDGALDFAEVMFEDGDTHG